MAKKVNGGTIAIIVLLAVIVVGVLAILAAFLLPTLTSDELSIEKQLEAVQEARRVYQQYVDTYGSTEIVADYYFYQKDEKCVVPIENGRALDVYTSMEAAAEDTIGTSDLSVLFATGIDKLYAYRKEIVPLKPDGDDTLSILMIGNSFSVDAIEYVPDMALSAGVKNIHIGSMFIPGCSLSMHATNAKANASKYHFYVNTDGEWNMPAIDFSKKSGDTSLLEAITSHGWDYICIQQVSHLSGKVETYNDDLEYMIRYINMYAPNSKLIWHMTWAYQQDSTHSEFPNYNSDQTTMYNAILSAVQEKVVADKRFAFAIPCGTAVQNARSSLLGDTITSDGYHMSQPFGRYLTAMMVVKALGVDIDDVTFLPQGITAKQQKIIKESVNNAYDHPFEITQSQYQN